MSKSQIRSSQVVTTFGPGAMVDLPESSVIIAGLDHWKYDLANLPFVIVEEPRLSAKLAVILQQPTVQLRLPPPAGDDLQTFKPRVPGWIFPNWFIVQRTEMSPLRFRRRRLIHGNNLDAGQFRDHDGKKHPAVPVRFVRACECGHLGDLDWNTFVHGTDTGCRRDLWMEERGTTGDLAEVWVVCECGKERAMSQAAQRDLKALGNCNGSRPWLGPGTKEQCGRPNRMLLRGASNAYFPQLLPVISIPDSKAAVDDRIRSAWNAGLGTASSPEELKFVLKIPNVASLVKGLSEPQVWESIQRVRSGVGLADRPVKEVEFEAMSEAGDEVGADEPEGIFFARALPKEKWSAPWMHGIERIALVHRLREVIAQVGFTRFESARPDIAGELDLDVERAPLTTNCDWLPAVEHRGEGIFLQFSPDVVQEWLKRPAVIDRGRQLEAGYSLWKAEHEKSSRRFAGLPYILLHSFAHLLLVSISLECGYPASSLRERIYAPDGVNLKGCYGILIYTGSSDAEGTLGGLVLAGRDIRRHVRRALEMARLCSNDPVCAAHTPHAHDHQPLAGSACHGCLFVAETSCEQRNEFLDRSLVVPTVENLNCDFFPSDDLGV